MTWYPEAKDKEDARYLQQKENTETNFKRLWRLKQQPCADCGLRWHPHAMTFDHVDRKGLKYKTTKTGHKKPVNIGDCLYWNPVAFTAQLKLMDVVCRNCHLIREAKRDINDPKVSYRNKDLFPKWFEQCDGALVKGQVPITENEE
jgi:hypothetical protein